MSPAAPIGLAAAQLIARLLRRWSTYCSDVRVEALPPREDWLGVCTLTVRFAGAYEPTALAIRADEGLHEIAGRVEAEATRRPTARPNPERN